MKTISEIRVKKFRNLSDVTVPVGKRITAIAGQNGTSKTSLLGMISHVFSYYPETKMLNGDQFSSKYSEIFRFSFPKYDKPGEHIYSVLFEDGEEIGVNSTERIDSKKRKSLRLKVGEAKIGRGKVKVPVAYLGMKRLYPFAQENKATRDKKSILNQAESEEYGRLHNSILLMDEDIFSSRIKTRNKDYFAPETSTYDHVGISAGQDNIGQIITTLISFRRLKDDLGSKYIGGIILIDELDASLYPAAQMKLVEMLFALSKDLDLQIFFTTHSLEILEAVAGRTKNGDGTVIYLDKGSGNIVPKVNPDLERLRRALKVLGPAENPVNSKINVYIEDGVARDFAESITSKEVMRDVKYIASYLSESVLQTLADAKLPDLEDSLFVVDGDISPASKNVIRLPGDVYPELVIFNHLKSLDKSDSFWSGSDEKYTKQFCFKDCPDNKDKEKVKKWYKEQKSFLKKQTKNAWKSWGDINAAEVASFNEKIARKIEKLVPKS